jgi:dethiobiotin synthetase
LLVYVAGTHTGVGKTWWTATTARNLRDRGISVRARKPVQSGDGTEPWDADLLAAATGDDPARVCPPDRTYRLAWAPPMAAAELGRSRFVLADLTQELGWEADTAIGFVESVGGPRSPMAADGDCVDFAHTCKPDLVVLVADAGLGAISAVRLSITAFAGFPVVVALNRYTGEVLQQRNRDVLVNDDHLDVLVQPGELGDHLAARAAHA